MQSKGACDDQAWQAASLKLLHERPFASLFLDSIDHSIFDPTGLEHVNNTYYVVFNRQASLCASPPDPERDHALRNTVTLNGAQTLLRRGS